METDLILHLDARHPGGLRAAVADAVRQAVLDGRLRADQRVPSSRSLAAALGVSRGSVVAGIDQLVGEGYLVARARSGTVVAPSVTSHPLRLEHRAVPANAASTVPVLDLRPGIPSTRGVAGAEWRSAWRAAAAVDPPEDAADPRGSAALRAQIADQLHRSRGVLAHADDVIVTSGTADAIEIVVRAVADPLDRPARVVVEDPGYPAVRRRLTRMGAVVIPVPVAGDGIDVALLLALDPVPDVVVLTPSHQYPTGGRLAADARLTLTDWAVAHGVLLVEDDYDSEFRHVGAPLPALAALDSSGAVVHVGSFSKTISPWLRMAFVVVRETSPLRGRIEAERGEDPSPVSGMVQLALSSYLASGALRRHLARARRAYAHRRRLLLDFFADVEWGSVSGLDGGLHAVVSLPAGVSAGDVVAELAVRGVLVASLDDYYANGRSPHPGLVLSYGGPGDLAVVRALEEVDAVVRAHGDRGIQGYAS
ncbi:PLP-dependent aminotransferase family protein [Microbacteriaceae bacterium VKM Ac-2854]|nr:PLP-dependent aminotransferase family protein [Microbacteriaceae bacterium VKM Ac-2854]